MHYCNTFVPIEILDVCEPVMNINGLGLGGLASRNPMEMVVDVSKPPLECLSKYQ